MGTYSIKDLENISGIKAHTLRIWEQRYNLLQPKRTDTNIRYYDADDLKLLLNVSLLYCNGMKISQIAKMSTADMHEQVVTSWNCCDQYNSQVNALTLAMIDMDEERFEKIISKNILQMGFEKSMIRIIYPFFEKLGLMWQSCSINPAQEHFISHLIRQKLIVAIDGQVGNAAPDAKRYLLFLPEGELHELGLLFAAYIIKSRGGRIIYLGQTLPYEDLKFVYQKTKPDYLFTLFTNRDEEEKILDYIAKMSADFSESKLLLSGGMLKSMVSRLNGCATYFTDVEEMVNFVEKDLA